MVRENDLVTVAVTVAVRLCYISSPDMYLSFPSRYA